MKLAAITRTGSYFLTLFLFTLTPSAGNAGQYQPDQPEKIKPYKNRAGAETGRKTTR